MNARFRARGMRGRGAAACAGSCSPALGRRPRALRRLGGSAPKAAGFTLIEIVVAFAILALGLTLLIGTLSGATRQLRQAGDAGRAALHAQSLLDEHALAPEPGETDGVLENGRYRWRLQVAPWDDPAMRSGLQPAGNAPRLLRVQVRVEWGAGGAGEHLQLATLRYLVPRGAAGETP